MTVAHNRIEFLCKAKVASRVSRRVIFSGYVFAGIMWTIFRVAVTGDGNGMSRCVFAIIRLGVHSCFSLEGHEEEGEWADEDHRISPPKVPSLIFSPQIVTSHYFWKTPQIICRHALNTNIHLPPDFGTINVNTKQLSTNFGHSKKIVEKNSNWFAANIIV